MSAPELGGGSFRGGANTGPSQPEGGWTGLGLGRFVTWLTGGHAAEAVDVLLHLHDILAVRFKCK